MTQAATPPRSTRATLDLHARSNPADMVRPRAPKVVLALATVAAGACTASGDDVRPPRDQFAYPTGLLVTPDEERLLVANANSDLKYDSGTVVVVALDTVEAVADAWVADAEIPAGCARDFDQPATLVCDEAMFIEPDAGVRIGNFATALAAQDFGDGTLRVLAAVRGDPSLTWLDWSGDALACSDDAQGFALCDDVHRLTEIEPGIEGIEAEPMASEPFSIYVNSGVDGGPGYALVSHLTSGTVTLVDLPTEAPAANPPRLVDELTGMFSLDSLTGAVGAASVVGRTPGEAGDIVYVTSRTDDRVAMVTVVRDRNARAPYLVPSDHWFLDAVGVNSGFSADARAAAFGAGGDRYYVVNREPPSLQVYDTSTGPTGAPQRRALAATDLCREAAGVVVADAGDGERAYVSCFRDGELYVVDPSGAASVEAVTTVGRGPFGLAVAATRQKLFVTNFLEDTVAVIELDPTSPRRYQVVLRIGEVRS